MEKGRAEGLPYPQKTQRHRFTLVISGGPSPLPLSHPGEGFPALAHLSRFLEEPLRAGSDQAERILPLLCQKLRNRPSQRFRSESPREKGGKLIAVPFERLPGEHGRVGRHRE